MSLCWCGQSADVTHVHFSPGAGSHIFNVPSDIEAVLRAALAAAEAQRDAALAVLGRIGRLLDDDGPRARCFQCMRLLRNCASGVPPCPGHVARMAVPAAPPPVGTKT